MTVMFFFGRDRTRPKISQTRGKVIMRTVRTCLKELKYAEKELLRVLNRMLEICTPEVMETILELEERFKAGDLTIEVIINGEYRELYELLHEEKDLRKAIAKLKKELSALDWQRKRNRRDEDADPMRTDSLPITGRKRLWCEI